MTRQNSIGLFLVTSLLFFIATGCTPTDTGTNKSAAPFAAKADVLAVLDDFQTAWNAGDAASVLDILADNGSFMYGWPAKKTDKAGYAKVIDTRLAKEPVISFKYKKVVPAGDVVKVKLVGTYSSGPANETYTLALIDNVWKIKSWQY